MFLYSFQASHPFPRPQQESVELLPPTGQITSVVGHTVSLQTENGDLVKDSE